MEQTINFNNGLATLIEGQQPINEEVLRNCNVYGKLMLSKGNKFKLYKTKASLIKSNTLMTSSSKKYVRAELLYQAPSGALISQSQRVFLNVDLEKSQLKCVNNQWMVKLIHPTFDAEAFDEQAEIA